MDYGVLVVLCSAKQQEGSKLIFAVESAVLSVHFQDRI